jgi:pyrroline-5-carboxylate reductase
LNKIALIGAGNMGTALVKGLVDSGEVSGPAITVFDIDQSKCLYLSRRFQTVAAAAPAQAVQPDVSMIVLAVKPQIVGPVLDQVAPRIKDRPLLVSIAAGVSTEFILSRLQPGARVIRAMPNAAATVGMSATALCKAGAADDADLGAAAKVFAAFGTTVVVEEKAMNAVTALSGSGPGYLFVILEGLADGGVRMGLDRATARSLAVQTMLGAAAMAAQQDTPFSELKDRITSPGGTTIAGLQALERAGIRGILMDAVEAATRRGDELQSAK